MVVREQRLSKLSFWLSDAVDFDPFLVRSSDNPRITDVTACMWISDVQDLNQLRSWTSHWKGSASPVDRLLNLA